MKSNITIRSILILAFGLSLFFGCESEQNDFEEFLTDGENSVAIGAFEGVLIQQGIAKINLGMILGADPKITKALLTGPTAEFEFDIVRSRLGVDTIWMEIPLAERVHSFDLIAQDATGKGSIPFNFSVQVYGDNYQQFVRARGVESEDADGNNASLFNPSAGEATITFGDLEANLVTSRVTYTNRTDEEITVEVPNTASEVVIDDFTAGGTYSVVSVYTPPLRESETAFEQFTSDPITGTFPGCTGEAMVTVSSGAFDFGQIDNGLSSIVESFTVQSPDCLVGDITLTTGGDPFGISTVMNGPFTSSIVLESIAQVQTVYVQFTPTSGRNQVYSGQVSITGSNIASIDNISLAGEETGNMKSGLNILNAADDGPFATVALPNDALPRLDWGGTYHEALFDGNTNTHGHGDIGSNPAHFTIDLGQDYLVTDVGWKGRNGFDARSLKRYQVWGLPGNMDINAAATTTALTPATETDWSIEMNQKGWVSMVDASLTDNPGVPGTTHDVSGFVYVRYIRVAVFESFADSFFNFGELELTANFGN